jgi:hypothetical protein
MKHVYTVALIFLFLLIAFAYAIVDYRLTVIINELARCR